MAEFKVGGMKLNKNMTYVSLAAAGGILAYVYYRRRAAGKANTTGNPSDTSTSPTDSNIDPATGTSFADEYGGGYQGYGGGYPAGYYPYYPAASQGAQPVTTNAQWAQNAETYLVSVGMDSASVAVALGKALTGQFITADQLAVFDAARAFEGEPPQTYPPLNTHPPGGQGGGGGGTGGGGGSTGISAPTNFRVTRRTRTSISVAWNAVSGAHGYHVYRNGTYAGRTSGTGASITGLARNHQYDLSVKAFDGHNNFSPASHLTASTSR